MHLQLEVDGVFAQSAAWNARAIRNIAGMGFFSVDRTINDYATRIWN